MCKKYSFVLVISTLILSIITTVANAQIITDPEVPCPGGPDDPGWTEDGCHLPLDNWVYILVIAAVIFGAYKLHQKQKALTA